MSLLDLPLEILDVIMDLSLPDGIEGFALSCRAIYERAAPQIRRHNALKHKWRITSNRKGRRIDDTLQIIYDISHEPLAAEYIEVLDLWDDREPNDGHYLTPVPPGPERRRSINLTGLSLVDFRDTPGAFDTLKGFITRSFQFNECGINMEEVWEDMMKAEIHPELEGYAESTWTVISLLSLLSNVKTLRLPGWWEGPQESAGNALDLLVRAANMVGAKAKPLQKLDTILPYMESGYEEKTALQGVQACMLLGGMKELYLVSAVAVDDGYTGQPFAWRYPGLNSSITRMEFSSCCMDAECISALVEHTPNLAVFKYSHETKWHGCQHDWNPGTFVEALGRHCAHSLKELALTLDSLYGAVINGASSFRALHRLEKLEADLRIFCGPPVESGQRLGEDAHVPEGENVWTTDDIPCIGSMLPENIREVQINTDHERPDRDALIALTKNLAEQRGDRLHQLEKVVIREYGGNSMQDIADKAGATLELLSDEAFRPNEAVEVAEWKRMFNERTRKLLGGFPGTS